MVGRKRNRKKEIRQAGWTIVSELYGEEGGCLELQCPEGKPVTVEGSTTARIFQQAVEMVRAGAPA